MSSSLRLDRELMRDLGYRAVDLLIDHFDPTPGGNSVRSTSPSKLQSLREPLPEQPTDVTTLLSELESLVFSNMMHLDHPRFFGYVPSPSNYVATIATMLAAGKNVFAGTWIEAPGPTEIELVTIDWLREICELPDTAGGLFTSGGSIANLIGLAAARDMAGASRHASIVYLSDQAHSSVKRALALLGYKKDQVRVLTSDDEMKLSCHELANQIELDRQAGYQPTTIIASAGTTNTGSCDPLQDLATLARGTGLWLHVDAAYGGPAMLTPEGRSALQGLGDAHSVTLDPHKWLFQPFDIGCLLVRDCQWLEQTFRVMPEYLQDALAETDEINFCDRGIELTRPFRALKLWMTFKTFGRDQLSAAVQIGMDNARFAECEIRCYPNWRIVTPAQLGIVTFRFIPANGSRTVVDQINRDLARVLLLDGFATMSTTQIHGRPVCRLCTINPQTTKDDLRETILRLNQLALDIFAGNTG